MSEEDLSPDQITAITAYVDIEAPPPADEPTACVIFGTNQPQPATIAAERYHRGLAPLIIATGGVNRHTGIIEGHMFHDLLTGAGCRAPRSGSRTRPPTPGRTWNCRCRSCMKPWRWGCGATQGQRWKLPRGAEAGRCLALNQRP